MMLNQLILFVFIGDDCASLSKAPKSCCSGKPLHITDGSISTLRFDIKPAICSTVLPPQPYEPMTEAYFNFGRSVLAKIGCIDDEGMRSYVNGWRAQHDGGGIHQRNRQLADVGDGQIESLHGNPLSTNALNK